MKFELHPEALAALNEQADQICKTVVLRPPAGKSATGFKPDVHVSANLTKNDLRGPIEVSGADDDGNAVSRFVEEGSGVVGFDEAAYAELRKLAWSIHKKEGFREKVSVGFLEDALFHWSLGKVKGNIEETACEYISREAEKRVCRQEMWVPVYGLHVQSSFRVGPVTFKTITRELVDEWQRPVRQRFPDKPEILLKLDRDRRELLGFAAATYEVEAEPERAKEMREI